MERDCYLSEDKPRIDPKQYKSNLDYFSMILKGVPYSRMVLENESRFLSLPLYDGSTKISPSLSLHESHESLSGSIWLFEVRLYYKYIIYPVQNMTYDYMPLYQMYIQTSCRQLWLQLEK
jgi:hypothetical protein